MCRKWLCPEKPIMYFRLTQKKYADAFLEKGSIKFNTPQYWEDKKIDVLEGSIASCPILSSLDVMDIIKKYSKSINLSCFTFKDKLYFKNTYSMGLYCFCLYNLSYSKFPVPNNDNFYYNKISIDSSYFKDFTDVRDEDDFKKISDEKRPYLIIIKDVNSFIARLYNKLFEIGIDVHSQLLHDNIKYRDCYTMKNKVFDFKNYKPPFELFYKNRRFENQSETRFLIKNTDKKIINKLRNPILLGKMSDISRIMPITPDILTDGIEIALNGELLK